jgi:hypothetical protein
MRKHIFCGLLIVCWGVFHVSEGFAQLHCSPLWTPEYKCLEHCGPCPTIAGPPRQQQMYQLELKRQQDLRHQREEEEMELKGKADEADARGLIASNRGDWKDAANWFMEALGFAPGSPEIRAHLDQANAELRDTASAAEILALHQRIEDTIAAARIKAVQQRLEDEIAAQRFSAMLEHFLSQPNATYVPSVRERKTQVTYPVLRRSVWSTTPPARVLAQYQPQIKTLDDEIHHAQDALRHLIASNRQSEEARLEWTRESEQATVDAQHLGVSLVFDLVGAHVDELARISGEERAGVLYKTLSERKSELERIQSELRLRSKLDDLEKKTSDFSVNRDTDFTRETLWDIVSQFKKVEDLAGPSKDLLDAAYTIYRQAASFENLAAIQANQERTLQAAAVLRRYILRLEAQKRSTRTHASRPTARAHAVKLMATANERPGMRQRTVQSRHGLAGHIKHASIGAIFSQDPAAQYISVI